MGHVGFALSHCFCDFGIICEVYEFSELRLFDVHITHTLPLSVWRSSVTCLVDYLLRDYIFK